MRDSNWSVSSDQEMKMRVKLITLYVLSTVMVLTSMGCATLEKANPNVEFAIETPIPGTGYNMACQFKPNGTVPVTE